MPKFTNLLANGFLAIILLIMIIAPVGSLGVAKYESNVLSLQDQRCIYETEQINAQQKLILELQKEIEKLKQSTSSVTNTTQTQLETDVELK